MSSGRATGGAPGELDGPGLLERDAASADLTFRRLLRHPIQEVWAAITDPTELEAWFMARVRREPAPGGLLTMEHPNGVHASGHVLAWEPPNVYEYEWNLPPGPSQPRGERSIVRWELRPADLGTILTVTHRRLSRPTAEVFLRGLPVFLDRLAARLDGGPLPSPPWVRTGAAALPSADAVRRT